MNSTHLVTSKSKSNRLTAGVRRWLREPLVHFLLIGMALFIVYRVFTPSSNQPSSMRIELSEGDLRQLQIGWTAQWQRSPTADEMRGLIDDRIKQEILYREALALGLDQGDEIVKRRMAQKMDFLAEDPVAIREPTPQELSDWFQKNAAQFTLPGRITFRHLYFSPDKRGQQAREDAALVLSQLAGKTGDVPARSKLSDPFMYQDYYADSALEDVTKVFGTKFAESLFKLKAAGWQGPVESGLGWHLVWIDSITPGRVPALEEVDPAQVKSEWAAEQRAESKRKAFEALKAKYEIVLPK